jgi:hypothetical protein
LGHKFSKFANDLIGIQRRVEALESLLKLNSKEDDIRVLGVWGMGGIGKTTLASVLYDRISYQFDASCFIENFSDIYRNSGGRHGGATAVHKRILCQTMDEKNLDVYSPSEISGIVMNRLCDTKLLVVLDDVEQYEQLLELNLDPKSLLAGSRIIITTRDEHILKQYEADEIYEACFMDENDAHKLLCRKAFKNDHSNSTFQELVHEVLKHAQLLPLAIGVMGSFLYRRDAMQWRATLDGWQNNPNSGIMKVLQTSFEGLEQREREIFLHIACFFQGERDDYVRKILDACGLYPNIGISLVEKSLITLRNEGIHMHVMLQELGKQVVRGQHCDEPGLWSRLWLYRDFHRAMRTKTVTYLSKQILWFSHLYLYLFADNIFFISNRKESS